MSRKFKTPDYQATLNQTISLGEALLSNHLARFVVDVIAQLDLSVIYNRYALCRGEAIALEILLGLLFYDYATGLFSSHKIERVGRTKQTQAKMLSSLTRREREVMQLLAEGKTDAEIAGAMRISVYTASTHVRNILTKLNVENRVQAAMVWNHHMGRHHA